MEKCCTIFVKQTVQKKNFNYIDLSIFADEKQMGTLSPEENFRPIYKKNWL